jgi:chromate transporter
MTSAEGAAPVSRERGSAFEVFRVALLLGLTSFGGPIAHLGYFHNEYVIRRRWLAESTYLDLLSLCQFLPGPASSQLGIGIGLLRAGWGGAVAAWCGFTLPSAVALTAFALLTADLDLAGAGWVHGLKLAAVAIVAVAVLSMWRTLAPDRTRKSIALVAAAVILVAQMAVLQVVVLGAGGLVGWRLLTGAAAAGEGAAPSPVSRRAGVAALVVFFGLLIGLPLIVAATRVEWVAVVDAFYRAGALVFGGGHVVLPLLNESVVTPGWVAQDTFLAGYGAAQAVPGPLFTFAAFLGASLTVQPTGIPGAAVALGAIFLPSFLLVVGAFPFWDRLRRSPSFRGALAGTNAAVIGLLIAALYEPVWTSAVVAPIDVALVVLAVGGLVVWNAAPWLVVGLLAVAGQAAQRLAVG